MLIFLMSYKQTYQIMVISVKTFKFDAWNKANKIITNLHNLVADIIMTLNFPLIILVVKCASIISNSAYIILHCKMFYAFYFSRNMLTSPWLLYLFVCGGVGGWVCVLGVGVCEGMWEFVNTLYLQTRT